MESAASKAYSPGKHGATRCGDGLESRQTVLMLALCISGIFSGVVYGWAALVQMMKEAGVYKKMCEDEDDEDQDDDEYGSSSCAAREVALNFIFSVGVFATFASRLPLGVALDRLGSKITVTFSLIVGAIGAVFFAKAKYALGFGLIAAGGPGVHIGAMHVSNLFAANKLTVLGYFSTAFQISSFLFALLSFFSPALVSLEGIFLGYACVLFLAAATSWSVVQPTDKYKVGDEVVLAPKNCSLVVVKRISDAQTSTRNLNMAIFPAEVRRILRSYRFWALAAYKSSIFVSLQFFVATLQARQDRATSMRVASRAANIIFNALGAFLGVFIAAPLIGPLLDRDDHGVVIVARLASLQAMAFNVLLAASELASWPLYADLPSYLLWASARVCFFAYFFAHVVKLFGHQHFGTLVGVLSLVAAIASFSTATPLARLAFRVKGGIVSVGIGLLIAISLTHAVCEIVLFGKADDKAAGDTKRTPDEERNVVDVDLPSPMPRVASPTPSETVQENCDSKLAESEEQTWR